MAQRVFHHLGVVVFWGLCCLAVAGGVGCAKHEAVAPPVVVAPVSPVPAKPLLVVRSLEQETAYDRGVRAYDAGEVKRALALWREATTVEIDQNVRQKALFALASVKAAQASSETELTTALELLEAWARNAPPGGSGEDPRFLLPALHAFKPAFAVKELKASLERECARKLVEREEQVRRSVQQQVKALENIHQQIQEKKKGLTNY